MVRLIVSSIFIFFSSICIVAQSNGKMKVTILNEIDRECITDSITLVLDDTLKYKYLPDSTCNYILSDLNPGKHSIKVTSNNCNTMIMSGIVVSVGKTAYVTLSLIENKQKLKKRRKKINNV